MSKSNKSRRLVLKQFTAMTALTAISSFRPVAAFAAAVSEKLYTTKIPGVEGKVIKKGDGNYELWRRAMIWHHSKPKRYPDLIVQVRSTADVVAAVKYAADNKLKVSVRAGGHNSTGSSVRQGGMVIDVSALRSIDIDPDRMIASVQPGVRSQELTMAAEKHQLSFPVPHCPSVGLSGFTMGGGIGLNYAQQGGMAVHSIVGAEVVTADGQVLTVNAKTNPDLFWAIRGAGPGIFCVVTRLELQLYPLSSAIMTSSYISELSQLASVTQEIENIRRENDISQVEVLLVLTHHPEAPPEAPPEQSKICFLTAFAYEDTPEQARAALAPFTNSKLAKESVLKMEHQEFSMMELYEKYFSLRDPAGRQGRYKVDNVLTNDGSGTLLALAEHFQTGAPTRDTHILASYNMNTQKKSDSCFSWKADCYVGCYAIWDDEKTDDQNYQWLKGCLPRMDPFAVGHYVNEVEPRHEDRYRKCFSPQNWQRLAQLRDKYDSAGVFHGFLTQEDFQRVSM